MSTEIKGYILVNDDKVHRCYDAELGAGPLATDEQVLTFYAKFGGLIKKGAEVVKSSKNGVSDKVNGGTVVPNETFWNFKERKAVKMEAPKKEVKEEVEPNKTSKKSK